MPKIVLILMLCAAYGLGYWGYGGFLRGFRDDHEYHRAQAALESLQQMTQAYADEHGSLPDFHDFNTRLRARWNSGRDHVPKEEENDPVARHLDFIIGSACGSDLYPWNSPPCFVLTSANPDGFGFYLHGEDGISKTQGRDRDDINSWDRSSTDFYHERGGYRRVLKKHATGAALAFVVFMIYLGRRRNAKPKRQRHDNL